MRHTRSSAEWEIREALVEWIREYLPGYRVVHEMNAGCFGPRRIDVAAIGTEEIVTFEIKSERDKLDRLEDQMSVFATVSHCAVAVCHEKFFEIGPHPHPSIDWLVVNPGDGLGCVPFGHLWIYPPRKLREEGYRWELPTRRWGRLRTQAQPRAKDFLGLLWRDELFAECQRHRIGVTSRATREWMIPEMAWLMTGREIAQAVCRQLRARDFAEADAPIYEASDLPTTGTEG